MSGIEEIVVVSQKTWLDELVEKFNTKEQAKFYIEHNGGDFTTYLDQHLTYYQALKNLKRQLPTSVRYQVIEKSHLPQFLFNDTDLVIVLGRDGLIVNTAKYLNNQPILGVNPDPTSIHGVLLQFQVSEVQAILDKILSGNTVLHQVRIAEAKLHNGQSLLGVNDIFIGHKSHQSARYQIEYNGIIETHSSSGIIVSTGLGSTGWYKSIVSTAVAISNNLLESDIEISSEDYRIPWDSRFLLFCIRESWCSPSEKTMIHSGKIFEDRRLTITSMMPDSGVIFSDGIEEDYLPFNSGSTVEIYLSEKILYLYQK